MLIKKIAASYKRHISVPKVAEGRVIKHSTANDTYTIEATFKLTDCDIRRKLTFKKLYEIKLDKGKLFEGLPEERAELAQAVSDKYLAKISVQSSDKQILTIYENSKPLRLLKSINVSDLEAHGPIVLKQPFYAFRWKDDRLLYSCLTKAKKYKSLFESEQKAEDIDQEFNKKEDWGETLVGIDHTIVGVLNVRDQFKVSTINMADYSLADSHWLENGNVFSIAYQETPRFGLVYCNNRPTIVTIHNPETGELLYQLKKDGICFHTLRVNNMRDKFLIAENPAFGPHNQPSTLKLFTNELKLVTELTDPLFFDCVPERCFSSSDNCILYSHEKGFVSNVKLLNVNDLSQNEIEIPCKTVTSMDFKHDLMVICGSSINVKPSLHVCRLDEKLLQTTSRQSPKWVTLEEPDEIGDINYHLHQDITTNDEKDNLRAIFIQHKMRPSMHRLSLFVIHGGPNSSYSDSYYEPYAWLAKLGLNVILVNYRGSTGVDKAHLHALSGKAGIMDVEDCSRVINFFIEHLLVDPDKMALWGGSHGGFLTGQLSVKGEFPFTSAVLVNPVLDFVSSLFTTDIPEWVTETALGVKYDPNWMPKEKDVCRMFSQSALHKAGNCKVPTLMLLGSKDVRVKMYQGLRYIEHLKNQGVETSCKIYPDTHQLLDHTPDCWVSAATWLIEHAGKAVIDTDEFVV